MMLQRFPVESKGRRKKLQEVRFGFCWSEFFGGISVQIIR
jgi:hypothetical protein